MNNPLKNNLLLKTTKSMATKCIVLGQPESEKKGKPIEFVKFMCMSTFVSSNTPPSKYDNIELICKGYNNQNQDLIYAYDSDRNDGILYLGHWNDGYVE
jgi:hypothetical protein